MKTPVRREDGNRVAARDLNGVAIQAGGAVHVDGGIHVHVAAQAAGGLTALACAAVLAVLVVSSRSRRVLARR